MLTDSRADSDLCEYGEYVDRLLWTVELFNLPADAQMSTLRGRLLDPAYEEALRNAEESEPYDLLACLIQTMTVLGIADTDTLAEYVEAIGNEVPPACSKRTPGAESSVPASSPPPSPATRPWRSTNVDLAQNPGPRKAGIFKIGGIVRAGHPKPVLAHMDIDQLTVRLKKIN